MSEPKNVYQTLEAWLVRTRDTELDCDQFLNLLAPFLDGRLQDAAVRNLIEHHRDLCAECAEELQLLERALEGCG